MREAFGSAEMLSCRPALLPAPFGYRFGGRLSSRLEEVMLKAPSHLPFSS